MPILPNPQSELLREPNLLIPGKKPVGAVKIDWEHPLTNGMFCCLLFNQENPYNYARGRFESQTKTTANFGVGADINGQYLHLEDGDRLHIGTENFTGSTHTLAFIRKRTDASGSTVPTWALDTNTAAQTFRCYNPYSNGTVYFDYGGTGSGHRISFSLGDNLNYEKWVFRAGPRGLAIWVDGVRRAEYTAAAASRTATTAINFFPYDTQNTGGVVFPLDYYQFLICESEWSDSQIISWSADPYQFLIPA